MAKKKFFLVRWFAGLFKAIGKIFDKLDDAIKINIEQVYDIVNRVKGDLDETAIDDLIVFLIPGDEDDKAVADLRAWLPGFLIDLAKIRDTPDVAGQNAKLLAAVNLIKTDSNRGMFLREIATVLIQRFSDGQFDLNDAAIVAATIYKRKKQLAS